MSASVVDQPRLSRTAPCARSGPTPMAASTWDGWTLPDEQAEPDDTAIPSRSKPITAVSAFSPGTVNSVVFGSRGTSSREHDHARGLLQAGLEPVAQALHAVGVAFQGGHGGPRGSAKARNARDILGSGPAAQLLSAAAQQRLQPLHALGQHQRADALGTADLVRRQRHQIGLQRC